MNCCDYNCHQGKNCPVRSTPTPPGLVRAANFQADTDRAAAKHSCDTPGPTGQELPNPTADLTQLSEGTPALASVYGLGLLICISGLSFLAGYVTGIVERMQ